jgi:hypothetical protein
MKLVLENVDQKFLHENDLVYSAYDRSDCSCQDCDYLKRCEVADGLGMLQKKQLQFPITNKILIAFVGIFVPLFVILRIIRIVKAKRNKIVPFTVEVRTK